MMASKPVPQHMSVCIRDRGANSTAKMASNDVKDRTRKEEQVAHLSMQQLAVRCNSP